MKVNLQKIIVLISTLSICLSLLCFPVSSYTGLVDYVYTTEKDAFLDTVNLINAYSNGEIGFDEFSSDLAYVQGKAIDSGLDVAALKIKQFYEICNLKFGADSSFGGSEHGGGGAGGSRSPITDIWNDICNKNNVPTEQTQTSTTDLKGSGALVVLKYFEPTRFNREFYFYCDYVIVHKTSNFSNGSKVFTAYDNVHYLGYTNGELIYDDYYSSKSYLHTPYSTSFEYYGDVRYEDDTPFPTDDEYVYDLVYNYDDLTDKQLKRLIEDLLNKIHQEYPDLSSIEGLLNAIYARLGTLDSDDDNQLLSEILTAIKVTDNTELLELLEDIKNALVFGDDENKENFAEQLKEFIDNQITREDFVIDEDLYNNHVEILKERLLGKFSFIYNIKTFVEYCFEQYQNTDVTPEIELNYNGRIFYVDFSFWSDKIQLFQFLIASFIYASYAMHTYRKIPSYINGGDNE